MPVPLVLTFVSTVAFAIQLLIFAYLYSSHRVRFFQYLLLAWGSYTVSKGLKLLDVLVLGVDHPSFVTDLTTVAAVGFTLAAGFAHRWSYRFNTRDLLIGSAAAVGLTLAGDVSAETTQRAVGVALGVIHHRDVVAAPDQDDALRFREQIAGEIIPDRGLIGHVLIAPLGDGGSADPLADRNAGVLGLPARERFEHQLGAVQHVRIHRGVGRAPGAHPLTRHLEQRLPACRTGHLEGGLVLRQVVAQVSAGLGKNLGCHSE